MVRLYMDKFVEKSKGVVESDTKFPENEFLIILLATV